jgi:DNA topoisomerase VI subunit A
MSKEEIEKETLRFMDLKLMDFTDKDLSLKMSDKKIEVECERKNYHKIESELPFKDFNEKMYKAELQDKANSKKAQTVQIE